MRTVTLAFETGVASHPGMVRRRNEDCYLVQPSIGVFAVADGMGGHEAGQFASATVVESLLSIGVPASAPDLLARFEDRVSQANSRLKQAARERGAAVIGATVAALLTFERYYACVWSGDSRIYRLRGGALVQISRDHTEAQELIDGGALSHEEARTWPRRGTLTRAIGVHDDAELEIEHGVLEAGDSFILCSDGLTTHVEDAEILERAAGRTPQQACDELVTLALKRGGTDNVTVVVVRCGPAAGGSEALFAGADAGMAFT
jgi:protein phosphatase